MSQKSPLYVEENEDPEAALKLEYLKANILNKGYDTKAFVELLEKEKTDGHRLELWTMEELKDMVELFNEERKRMLEEDGLEDGEEPHAASLGELEKAERMSRLGKYQEGSDDEDSDEKNSKKKLQRKGSADLPTRERHVTDFDVPQAESEIDLHLIDNAVYKKVHVQRM
jgi:hypothetical protein